MTTPTQKIVPSLWFAKDAEEAARFYASVFPDSHVDRVWKLPVDSPSGPEGSVKVVELTLLGQPFQAMAAGEHDNFNDAISFTVKCTTQEEIDRYWNAILKAGGKEMACGWITDKWGVRWQIVPESLNDMMSDQDTTKARHTAKEMMRLVKLDVGKLEAAFRS